MKLAQPYPALTIEDINRQLAELYRALNRQLSADNVGSIAGLLVREADIDPAIMRDAEHAVDPHIMTIGGRILAPDGTPLAPSFSFASNPNLGMYRIEANTLGFATSGIERLRIDDDGVVRLSENLTMFRSGGASISVEATDVVAFGRTQLFLRARAPAPALTETDVRLAVGVGAAEIGTVTAHPFHILSSGIVRATVEETGNFRFENQIQITGGTPEVGRVLTSDETGLGSWELPAVPSYTYVNTTTDYMLLATDNVVGADATFGSITLTLPSAVGIGGRHYTLKRIDASNNRVRVAGVLGQTIDRELHQDILFQDTSFGVVSDGANWLIT